MNTKTVTVVEAPNEIANVHERSVFLAGGITNWQDVVINGLHSFSGTILNPVRDQWPEGEGKIETQTIWERKYFSLATLRAFWFPGETDCPITLLELGFALGGGLPIVVGCHPNYSRKQDVQIQTRLSNPAIEIVETLDDLVQQIRDFMNRDAIAPQRL